MPKNKKKDTIFTYKDNSEDLAKDLHDGICQQLVTILWDLENLKEIDEKEKFLNAINQIGDQLRRVINDLQQIIYGVCPVLIDKFGFLEGIEIWAKNQLESRNIQFHLIHDCEQIFLSRFVTGQVFRIIQEGINNILRHAEAQNVILTINKKDGKFIFKLKDDGRGFDPESVETGLGLKNMRERVAIIEGDLEIISQIGEGTTLVIQVPDKGDDNR
ncbi:hypothetical protein BBF96_06730 [Anoxybacter fermentans]|uniref:Oxygen sensor histidine kinase NreB n=1 Tax=Anoxybacter fermentans TaxID=1323375 RepID=A0A3Q9HQ83_9FIRM|nr:ATP-binding protein [Anoxybacter fermentans]AZR73105.1 hypothetical protein BBF96_06730 [Anoxybacter fermentans]